MTSPIQYVSAMTVLLSLSILLLTIAATSTLIGAQIQSPSNANVTSAHKMGVKIISPTANTTLPTGQLTIHGISSDIPKTNN